MIHPISLRMAAGLVTLASSCWGAGLPAGTPLEVRLAWAAGSRASHVGDPIRAVVIGPAVGEDGQMLPRGSAVSGTVVHARSIGFGLKSSVATLRLRFDLLQLPDGRTFPLKTRIREIETAKERVDRGGLIQGVDPRANVSTGTSIVLTSIMADPGFAISLMAAKTLLARCPDPEIYLPPGSELVLEVTADAHLPEGVMTANGMSPLNREEVGDAQNLLASLPQLQAYKGKKHPSDLINVMLLGNREQVERAFYAAGWNGEQAHSALSLYRMYHCIVQRTGYAMAPMARLTLNGSTSQLTYQKSLNTFAKRHHIRFWKEQTTEAWLGAATEDVSFTFQKFRVTHEIDPEIDNERAKVVNDLWNTGCVEAGSMLPGDQLQRIRETEGTAVTDDGIAILRLNNCQSDAISTPKVATARRSFTALSRSAFRAVSVDLVRSNALFSTVGFTRAFIERNRLKSDMKPDTLTVAGDRRASRVVRQYQWQRKTAMPSTREEPGNLGVELGVESSGERLIPVLARRISPASQ